MTSTGCYAKPISLRRNGPPVTPVVAPLAVRAGRKCGPELIINSAPIVLDANVIEQSVLPRTPGWTGRDWDSKSGVKDTHPIKPSSAPNIEIRSIIENGKSEKLARQDKKTAELYTECPAIV